MTIHCGSWQFKIFADGNADICNDRDVAANHNFKTSKNKGNRDCENLGLLPV